MASGVSTVVNSTSGRLTPSRPTCHVRAYSPRVNHGTDVSKAAEPPSSRTLPSASKPSHIQRLVASGTSEPTKAAFGASRSSSRKTTRPATNAAARVTSMSTI